MQHTTTQPRITVIAYPSVFKKSTFVIALAVLGGITILAGIIGLSSAIILLADASLPNLATMIFTNAVVDMMVGTLIFVSSRAFAIGKVRAIWLFGGSILLDSMYSLIMSYQLHYIFMGLGFLLIWYMLKFRKEWEEL